MTTTSGTSSAITSRRSRRCCSGIDAGERRDRGYARPMPFAPHSPLGQLLNAPMRPGRVTWIGLRTARRAAMRVVAQATLIAGQGLDGDRYASTHDGPRQVTLIAAEDIAAIAAFLGRDAAVPGFASLYPGYARYAARCAWASFLRIDRRRWWSLIDIENRPCGNFFLNQFYDDLKVDFRF